MHHVHEYSATIALPTYPSRTHALPRQQGDNSMFVITGATGHTGSAAAKALLEQGKKVRVLARDAKKADSLKARGAEVVSVDLTDQAALGRAVAGAQGVYLI